MAPKEPPIILPPNLTLEKLVPVQQLLHLTVHRNKNQHRIAKWWANLQLLRRNLKRLVEMLGSEEAEYRKGKEVILKRCTWMENEVVPRVYLSFSAVVADNQYASLGLMLLGCLARVNGCVSFPRSRMVSDEEDEGRVPAKVGGVVPSEDLGEAITREEEQLEDEVVKEAANRMKAKKEKRRTVLNDDEIESSISRDSAEYSARKPLKREVLGVDGTSGSEGEQPKPDKKAKKAKKVSQKFLSEFEHLSGMSSSDEEPAPKKSSKRPIVEPEESDSDEKVKPVPKKIKKSTPGAKSSLSKTVKKKKKKGGDDLDDLFAGLM